MQPEWRPIKRSVEPFPPTITSPLGAPITARRFPGSPRYRRSAGPPPRPPFSDSVVNTQTHCRTPMNAALDVFRPPTSLETTTRGSPPLLTCVGKTCADSDSETGLRIPNSIFRQE